MRRNSVLTLSLVVCLVAANRQMPGALAQAGQQPVDEFRWSGQIAPGKEIEIKGINGNVDAVLAPGSNVEVLARKHARRSDPASVTFMVVEHDRGVTICAVYPTPDRSSWRRSGSDDGPNECRPGGEGRMNTQNNDVQVDFSVRVPRDVRFVGNSVNGSIVATSLSSDVEAYTVNGRVQVSTSGAASAETVNGSIDATLGSPKWEGALDFRTVNGAINLTLPAAVATELRAETMNGDIRSDFPISIQSTRQRGKRITGTIGSGGRELHISSLNGTIRLQSSR